MSKADTDQNLPGIAPDPLDAPATRREVMLSGLAVGGALATTGAVWAFLLGQSGRANGARAAIDPSVRPAFREPVVLASKDGVLEVRLTAHQGHATLDTVAKPVQDFLVYGYEVLRGTASNGEMSAEDSYPSPTLKVDPNDTLIIHMENSLHGLTIRDFYDPKYTAKGKEVPLYPVQLTSAPINLHTHGMHISPRGNSDNVLLHIPPGITNTFTYKIPDYHTEGAYWYHPHLHTLTSAEVYFGLAGQLAIGRLDGNIPLVTKNNIPIRNMVLQYNFVFDRQGGQAKLNNVLWPEFVSTLTPPKGDELEKGTYRPLLSPVNFKESKKGTTYSTVWYEGPLSINNNRGRLDFIPGNLKTFTANSGKQEDNVPADPSLPDYQRDVQFTVNGQFQPVIDSKAGQTEIWVLSNVSDMAYMSVQLTETATGRHPKIAIVGTDGNPSPVVRYPIWDDGTRLVIPPASRFAIAVTMPPTGDLVLELPPRSGNKEPLSEPAVLYTNDGTDSPPGKLGRLSVPPSAVSYYDGFFVFPTQVLVKAVPSGGQGVTTIFAEGQKLDANTSFEDLSKVTPDVSRSILITGGFLDELADKNDPRTFIYSFDGRMFPYVPLIQSRLGSVEEWQFNNMNNDEHPIHVHVNDFQITKYFDPTSGIRIGPQKYEMDNSNVPAPSMGPNETVTQPGQMTIRIRFKNDMTGLFVMHCHRLNHEDNGMMGLINIIPAVSSYAVAVPGAPGRAAMVKVYDGEDDRLLATVTPFPGFEGTPSVAMGDINANGIYDLIVGAGKGHAPEVVVYSGAGESGKAPFESELARFLAFAADARGGVSVTAADIEGTFSDNIIVGSGPGIASEVKVFSASLPTASGTAPALFSSFKPYGNDDRFGVTVASGFVDFSWGRESIVTAPGPGRPAEVKVFVYPLMKPNKIRVNGISLAADICSAAAAKGGPVMSASFLPFGREYRDGLSLATGWLYGAQGGAKRIVVGRLTGAGEVKVFSSGSALQGAPEFYLDSAMGYNPNASFVEDLKFTPFSGGAGVRVATTSTTTGAHLLVSGVSPQDKKATILKFDLAPPTPDAKTVQAVQLGLVMSADGSVPLEPGGD